MLVVSGGGRGSEAAGRDAAELAREIEFKYVHFNNKRLKCVILFWDSIFFLFLSSELFTVITSSASLASLIHWVDCVLLRNVANIVCNILLSMQNYILFLFIMLSLLSFALKHYYRLVSVEHSSWSVTPL